MAALEADDVHKRDRIDHTIDLPLRRVFRQFAALRGSTLYEEFRTFAVTYRMFVLREII